jgi:UDP-glucose 4-epimerase
MGRVAEREAMEVHRAIVPWRDRAAAATVLADAAQRIIADGSDVSIFWCAGAGVVATEPQAFEVELATLSAAVAAITSASQATTSRVRFFLASSAGGVYAGASDPPFSEETEPRPLAPYGWAKLAAEAAVERLADSGVSVLVGRIANLYGPGQNLTKPQGLIAQLCSAQLERRPLQIYVSLDTARDYVYVDDAAAMALACMTALAREPDGTVVRKIIASHQPTTLASVIGELDRVSKRRPPTVLGAAPSSRFQARDLRFRSVVWPEVDLLCTTPLPVGIAATLADVAARRAVRAVPA